MHLAAEGGHCAIVESLCLAGGNVNALNNVFFNELLLIAAKRLHFKN